MITIKNTQRIVPINTKKITKMATAMLKALDYTDYDLGISFTGTKAMQTYNKMYRGKDTVTDILSFPYHEILKPDKRIVVKDPEDKNLGDLIMCPSYVQKDASNRWNQSFDERLVTLLAHGIAHLLGHDHETEKEYAQMLKVESLLIKAAAR